MKTEEELYELLCRDPHKVQSLCRICLCDDTRNATPLFSSNEGENNGEGCKTACEGEGETVCDKMVACGRVRINRDDKLPKLICGACHYDLDIAHLFRVKCQQADALLRKVLEDAPIKKEQPDDEPGLIDDKNTLLINCDTIKKEYTSESDNAVYDDADDVEYTPVIKKKRKRKSLESTVLKDEKNIQCVQNIKLEREQIKSTTATDHDDEILPPDTKNNDRYLCELCDKTLSTKYVYVKHMKTKHGESRQIPSKKSEAWLITGQGNERRFHCPECDYKSRRRQGLQYHMATHTGARPFKCDQCPQSFTQHGRLYAHKKSHSDKTYYTCAECGKQFKHKDSFNKHKNVHSTEMNFVCHICNKALKTQKTLNEHINRHLQIKKFSCEFCGLAFVTRVDLLQHLRVHNDERKYKCTFCAYSSYSKGTLEVHIKRHTGERNFQCEYCNYTCFTRGTLKFHIRKHTKEQNYACPICDMKFRQSTSVNSHMLKKHGEKFKWSNTVDRRVVK